MFADDTHLFYSRKDIHLVFNTINNDLSNISHWYNSNKLSVNADKTKFTLFHKARQRDNNPLVLPTLKINNTLIKWVDIIKFLGVLFDKNLIWKNHIENKIYKSLGNLHQAKFLLNQRSRKNVYFSFIDSYINYGNIVWGSTHKSKLKKIFSYQKKAARVIFFADCLAHAKPLMLGMNVPNVYQINIYQNLILLYKVHTGTAPSMFFNKPSKISHNYLTTSKNSGNYTILKLTIKLANFPISRRGQILWNIVLDATLKEIESLPLFKAKA